MMGNVWLKYAHLVSELSKENAALYTNEKSSYLTKNTVCQWSANCRSRLNCGPFSTF